ncbi:DUF448 domain-containing protein [Croceicoccus naphthovorans]|uniref:Uncharacterized protein n=1 Tax=Croceicoccus naphthovorans TaxID=1348774 RepID=A0A0G3XE36_9SPHN|nr:DUF448 domain-containing protein [Croceicoccus naphthovorans]AKM08869.1 hypothetical protein AB433_00940 [Croceicoccus naphthovorans]MBB3989374.1 hypothetical protein [Croceicoccus naphthovorans]
MRNPHNEPLTDSFDDGAARSSRSAPERRCVLSGQTAQRENLLRLAIGPDGIVLPDAHAKAPGRGAWIVCDRAMLEEAIAKGHLRGALARGFKGAPLTIPDDLPDRAEAALTRAFADRLGIEWRSGNLIAGSDRIADKARGGQVTWLAHAADASDDGARKLDQAWRVGEDKEGTGLAGIRLPLDRAALSVALGRDNVVHLALTDRAATQRVSSLLARLLRFLGRGGAPQDSEEAGAESTA